MRFKKTIFTAISSTILVATLASSVTPAAAWCRFGRCGWGWGGPVAAGVVAGTVVGAAVAASARPVYVVGRPYPCPPGYHLGPYGRTCWINR